ncbi:MAG: hypothetical protein LBQ24_04805 [Candidatus Peribacteria bacterium]|nr:hypothetical protein [Candidatus Peribacteria bacterium]
MEYSIVSDIARYSTLSQIFGRVSSLKDCIVTPPSQSIALFGYLFQYTLYTLLSH